MRRRYIFRVLAFAALSIATVVMYYWSSPAPTFWIGDYFIAPSLLDRIKFDATVMLFYVGGYIVGRNIRYA